MPISTFSWRYCTLSRRMNGNRETGQDAVRETVRKRRKASPQYPVDQRKKEVERVKGAWGGGRSCWMADIVECWTSWALSRTRTSRSGVLPELAPRR